MGFVAFLVLVVVVAYVRVLLFRRRAAHASLASDQHSARQLLPHDARFARLPSLSRFFDSRGGF